MSPEAARERLGIALRQHALGRQSLDHLEVPAQVLWTKEVLLHPDASGGSHPVRAFSVGEQPSDGLAHLPEVTGVRDQQTRLAVVDLVPDSADPACDDRPLLPHRLGDRQPEALGEALLDNHAGSPSAQN